MNTKERLSRQALVLDTINEIQRFSPKAGEWLVSAILKFELAELEMSTTLADLEERYEIPKIDNKPLQ